MGLYVGAKEALAVHAGALDALAVYRGSELVWSSTPPPDWFPPVSDLTNTCNGPEGTEVTVANSAGGGDPWQLVNNWTYEAEGMSTPPVSQIANVQWDATGVAAIPDLQQSAGFWLIVDTAATARIHDMRNESNNATYGGIQLQAGTLRAVAGTTQLPESASPALVLGRRYWATYGINNAAAGSHGLLVQNPSGTVFHDWTGTLAGTGDLIGFRRFGKVTTSAAGLTIATIKATSGTSTGLPLEPA